MKVVVFDMGGTLMQYIGMPLTWTAYYEQGFRSIAENMDIPVSDEAICAAVERLTAYNPRIRYRETEYSPDRIFADVLRDWPYGCTVEECIRIFWCGLQLKAEIFADTWQALHLLRSKGYRIAVLTDLPSAMPDGLFQSHISELLAHVDCYVSSSIAGYRKPNPRGLQLIAEKYRVPVNELVFVGDEDKDERTALNANCRFIRISRAEGGEGIRDLTELANIL